MDTNQIIEYLQIQQEINRNVDESLVPLIDLIMEVGLLKERIAALESQLEERADAWRRNPRNHSYGHGGIDVS